MEMGFCVSGWGASGDAAFECYGPASLGSISYGETNTELSLGDV
jgi:hypothetical protein